VESDVAALRQPTTNPPPLGYPGSVGAVIDEVPIRGDMIRLGQLLKLSGLAEDGVHAKEILASEQVRVNGQPEARRGRQLVPGDRVHVGDRTLVVTSE